MIRQLAPERPAALEYSTDAPSATGLVAAASAVRGAAVAASGLILAAGLAMVLWAVTPSSGDEIAVALQGGVVAFASANLMPVVIGGVMFSLPPLLFTLVIAWLLVSSARRGRFRPQGRRQETVSVLVTGGVYGFVVAAITRGLGPVDAVPAGWVWTSAALAFVATGAGLLREGSAWRAWWSTTAPGWARCGVRGGGIGLGVMISGGGIALSVGLIAHFGSAVGIAAVAAPSWMDGLGMAMLGLAYIPNAVIAGAGYVSGVGFEIGAGTYSPLATSTIELPGVPLLAAAPDQSGRSWIGLAFLLVPVISGYLVARPATRNLPSRSLRLAAAVTGALLTGGMLAAAAAIAGGGVGDGRWSTIGAPPLLMGAVVAAEVGVVAVIVAVVTGRRSIPWSLGSPSRPRRSNTRAVEDTESVTAEPVTTESVTPESVTADSVTTDSVTAEPVTTESVTPEPVDAEPVASDNGAEEPDDDPKSEESAAQDATRIPLDDDTETAQFTLDVDSGERVDADRPAADQTEPQS